MNRINKQSDIYTSQEKKERKKEKRFRRSQGFGFVTPALFSQEMPRLLHKYERAYIFKCIVLQSRLDKGVQSHSFFF